MEESYLISHLRLWGEYCFFSTSLSSVAIKSSVFLLSKSWNKYTEQTLKPKIKFLRNLPVCHLTERWFSSFIVSSSCLFICLWMSWWEHFRLHSFNLITIALNILLLMLPLRQQAVVMCWSPLCSSSKHSERENEHSLQSLSSIDKVGLKQQHSYKFNTPGKVYLTWISCRWWFSCDYSIQ